MARRGAGEGAIYKRGDGRWVGSVQTGVDENGKRSRRVVYAKTRAEVQDKLDEERERVSATPWADPGAMSVGEFLTAWLRDSAAPRVRAGTLTYYNRVLRPARSTFGGVGLRLLSPMHVQAMLRQLEEQGASPRARQMVYTVLRTAIRDAVRMRLLAVNPLDAVSRPRASRPEIQALDAEQTRALLVAAQGDPFEAL